MTDKFQEIENSMLNPIHREIADLQPFSKMNYFKRGVGMKKNNYPKTRKTRKHVRVWNCTGKAYHPKTVAAQLKGE